MYVAGFTCRKIPSITIRDQTPNLDIKYKVHKEQGSPTTDLNQSWRHSTAISRLNKPQRSWRRSRHGQPLWLNIVQPKRWGCCVCVRGPSNKERPVWLSSFAAEVQLGGRVNGFLKQFIAFRLSFGSFTRLLASYNCTIHPSQLQVGCQMQVGASNARFSGKTKVADFLLRGSVGLARCTAGETGAGKLAEQYPFARTLLRAQGISRLCLSWALPQ